jgi:hypothetical protein
MDRLVGKPCRPLTASKPLGNLVVLQFCVQCHCAETTIEALLFFFILLSCQVLLFACRVCLSFDLLLARAIISGYYLVFRRVLCPALQLTIVFRLFLNAFKGADVVFSLCMSLHLIPADCLSLCTVWTTKSRCGWGRLEMAVAGRDATRALPVRVDRFRTRRSSRRSVQILASWLGSVRSGKLGHEVFGHPSKTNITLSTSYSSATALTFQTLSTYN